MELVHHCNKAFRASKLCHDLPEAMVADSIKGLHGVKVALI